MKTKRKIVRILYARQDFRQFKVALICTAKILFAKFTPSSEQDFYGRIVHAGITQNLNLKRNLERRAGLRSKSFTQA